MAERTLDLADQPEQGLTRGWDARLLAGWERSAVLRAPAAPPTGALAANGTGYLLSVGGAAPRPAANA